MRSKQFLVLVEGTADAAFAVDAAGLICAWNNASAELFGLSEAEAISVPCHKILQCSDENGVVCSESCVIERAAQENRPLVNFDLRVQTITGKQWCNLSILIASEPASGARYAIHIVRPREMRKRLEQALSEFVRTQARSGPNDAPTSSSAPTSGIDVRLTSREVEVLKSLAKGHSTRAIANQFNISSATVNNHIKHILTKLDAHTRLEAIRHAERVGVI
ncbi:MAG: LuxR C-terminal-related transcriptional regulator [Pyrinomonadaceae bacterium]